jgi:predicted membrane-bound spermidine synthase
LRAIPYIAFFLSGASSLIFQSLWTRMLHHTFGATSVAMSTVLSAFMSGLGLGAYLFGKRVARLRSPLRVYALAELGVAGCALLIPPLVRSDGFFALVNAGLRGHLGEGSFAFMVARFFCVLPILLVPTTLMGGTLPLLAQHFVDRQSERASARVGALYALNTLGAVAGTLLSSFVLMPAIGVRATNFVAVGINAALGLAILLFLRTTLGRATAVHSRRALPVTPAPAAPPRSQRDPKRNIALLAFALSGVCAMAYEVVWSRALAMAIGSSLQSFALILTTFLIGIAGGSGIASHLLRDSPRRGLPLLGAVSWLLTWLALAPALVLSSTWVALTALALAGLLLLWIAQGALRRSHELAALSDEPNAPLLRAQCARTLDGAALRCLLLPCAVALFEVVRFVLKRSTVSDVALHGYLPFITAGTVACCALVLALQVWLRGSPWLLAGGVQLAIALSTLASYTFQDEIPYSFARLVTAIRDLPSHIGTVRFFMSLAAGLCTLPAALGMGAMFPITLALWSERRTDGARTSSVGRDSIGYDVGRVYSANTIGSIIGAWLPGFVLLPWLGMERTLAIGMTVNVGIALLLLWSARSEPSESRRTGYVLALGAGVMLAALGVHGLLAHSPLSWNLSHMTLGAFRVSLAREVLDPEAWGQPDIVYYRDGISTTVSVERWGGHLSLKNNGKVDASNGDDMPTQIMVSAYPLLLHPRGPRDLEVAIVGFGSGVTVGAALEFPVRHVDSMELEEAVIDAALRFFSDVSHLKKQRATFPYLDHPRLRLFRDDGRNFLAATEKRYDVIVSEPSNPWITGVSDLFTVDHFQITKQKLKPGGVYCQWVQLYELSPENIKTVYRTFASQFAHVLAFSADELSSDTILLGSDRPFDLDTARLARSFTDPRVARELARARVDSPYDVWSRLLFASRDELLAFAQTESRTDEHGVLREVLRATGREPCTAPGCVRTPVPLNTDDNMLIELRAPSDLIGFKRYEGYLELLYGASWPYGDLRGRMRELGSDHERLAMAIGLLSYGRKERARTYFAQVDGAALVGADRVEQRTAALLLGALPAPDVPFEPPLPSMPMSASGRAEFDKLVQETKQALSRGDHALVLTLLERLPAPLRALSGPSLRFQHALALLRATSQTRARSKQAALELQALLRQDDRYAAAHPELSYYLARALETARSYRKSVRTMRRYATTTAEPDPR